MLKMFNYVLGDIVWDRFNGDVAKAYAKALGFGAALGMVSGGISMAAWLFWYTRLADMVDH
jgi:hypothetical protein